MNELSLSAQSECSLINNRRAGMGFYNGKCTACFLKKKRNWSLEYSTSRSCFWLKVNINGFSKLVSNVNALDTTSCGKAELKSGKRHCSISLLSAWSCWILGSYSHRLEGCPHLTGMWDRVLSCSTVLDITDVLHVFMPNSATRWAAGFPCHAGTCLRSPHPWPFWVMTEEGLKCWILSYC